MAFLRMWAGGLGTDEGGDVVPAVDEGVDLGVELLAGREDAAANGVVFGDAEPDLDDVFKTATAEELPDAVAVMDPFDVVKLAGDGLDCSRRLLQQDLHGHRSRAGDRFCRARRTLHTGTDLLADKQPTRIQVASAAEEPVEVGATWSIYQRAISACRHPDRAQGSAMMSSVIDSLSRGVRPTLPQLVALGRTLTKRATSRRSSTCPEPATDRRRPSTADSNTFEAPPSAAGT